MMQFEWLFVRRGIYLCLLVVILFISNSSAQVYPVWFLNQGEVNCGKTVAGFAKPSFYADSSAAQAIRNGYETYAKQLYAQVSGV